MTADDLHDEQPALWAVLLCRAIWIIWDGMMMLMIPLSLIALYAYFTRPAAVSMEHSPSRSPAQQTIVDMGDGQQGGVK